MKRQNWSHHHFHASRLAIASVLLVSVFVARVDVKPLTATSDVLAYANSISRSELLNQTNAYRAGQGLGALSLNSNLNTSAQNKAQHMITHNYWAHVAPDGTQPWQFFEQAGYNYQTAGENLAYGFSNSTQTMNGWINSPSHRDNILGAYKDVGFGYVNGPNYQGGQNTVIVAHYGTPFGGSPAPAPPAAPVEPEPTPTPQPQSPAASSPPVPAPTSDPTPTSTPSAPPKTPARSDPEESRESTANESREPSADQPKPKDVATADDSSKISVLETLSDQNAPAATAVSLSMLGAATVAYGATHRRQLKHLIQVGERYAVRHPFVDASVLLGTLGLILTATVGFVR